MNGIFLGAAMLIASSNLSPRAETGRAAIVPAAIHFDLADGASLAGTPWHRGPDERFRPAWAARHSSAAPAQTTNAKRSTKTGKIIGLVAGGVAGWFAGSAIGYAATSKPDDDVSGLRGVVIGAPIGAAVGAAIGYQLMK